MKTLLEYLKVKNIKGKPQKFPDDYCLVLAWEPIYSVIADDETYIYIMHDKKVGHPNVFLFLIDVVKENKYTNNENITVYKIPDDYNDMEDLKTDYEEGYIDVQEDCEKLNI